MFLPTLLKSAVIKKLVNTWPALINGMSGALIIVSLSHFLMPCQKIGTVNVTGILDQFIKENANKAASSDQLKMKVHLFGQTLEETLQVISKKEHVLLLPREAVMAESMDYTLVVTEHLKKSLSGVKQ